MTSATTRQAVLALVAPAVASGAILPGQATRLADAWARYLEDGRIAGDATAIVTDPPILLRTRGASTVEIQIPSGFYGARIPIAQPVDASGQPTSFGGPVTWTSENPELFAAASSQDDGMVGLVTLVQGAPEQSGVVSLAAPAGKEADAPELTNDVTVTIIPGDALGINPAGVELLRVAPAA